MYVCIPSYIILRLDLLLLIIFLALAHFLQSQSPAGHFRLFRGFLGESVRDYGGRACGVGSLEGLLGVLALVVIMDEHVVLRAILQGDQLFIA